MDNEDEDFLAAVEADNIGETDQTKDDKQPEAKTPKAPEGGTPEVSEGVEPEVLELTEVVEPPPSQNVPLSALLDERDRRKAEADRASMLEEQIARMTQSQQQQTQAPDPLEDPEAFGSYIQQQVQQNAVNTTLNMSEVMARQSYGDEAVNAAQQWGRQRMQTDLGFQRRVIGSPHPYQTVMSEFQREYALHKLDNDPSGVDDFLAWKAAQTQLTDPQQQPAPPGTQRTTAPPRSIASAPSAGSVASDVIPTEDELFDEVMKAK